MKYRGETVTSFVGLFKIIDDPYSTKKEKEEARKEVEEAMDDFS